jgi:TPR repeat protein
MLPVPVYNSDGIAMAYPAPCCGTITCYACDFEAAKAKADLNEKRAQKKLPPMRHCCEFCRAPIGIDVSESEVSRIATKKIKARAKKNDPEAIWQLATTHKNGSLGVPANEQKALELTKKAADLGNVKAQFALGLGYYQGGYGLEIDKEKGRDHWESAAKGGHVKARFALGRDELSKGNTIDSIRHLHIAAASGYNPAMDVLIILFEGGQLRHKDLAKSLRASDKACLDMRSDSRDFYLAHFNANRPR